MGNQISESDEQNLYKIIASEFNCSNVEFLDHGGYANVYKATDNKTKRQIAIKCISMPQHDKDLIEKMVEEKRIQDRFALANAVQTYYFRLWKQGLAFSMECMDGNLLSFKKNYGMNEEKALFVLNKVLVSLIAMEKDLYVHRDIKPENILFKCKADFPEDPGLEDLFLVKLSDYGISTAYTNSATYKKSSTKISFNATLYYVAPEILSSAKVTSKADVFSLMVAIHQILYNRHPLGRNFNESNVKVFFDDLMDKKPDFSHVQSHELRAIFEETIVFNPKERAAASDIYNKINKLQDGNKVREHTSVKCGYVYLGEFRSQIEDYPAIKQALEDVQSSKQDSKIKGEMNIAREMKDFNTLLLNRMCESREDLPEFHRLCVFYIQLNYCFTDVAGNILLNIAELCADLLSRLPKVSIKDHLLIPIVNLIKNTEYTQVGFEFKSSLFDPMVEELYNGLEQKRGLILDRLYALQEALKQFGPLLIDEKNFIKTRESLLNKVNRDYTRSKTDSLKYITNRDIIRVRLRISDPKDYARVMQYMVKHFPIVRMKQTFNQDMPVPMVYINFVLDQGLPAVELQVLHYVILPIYHFLYDHSRCEYSYDFTVFINKEYSKLRIELIKDVNGNVYQGQVMNGKKHGLGKYELNDGREYDGEWKDNKICGRGIYKSLNGEVYEGEWKDNKRCGRGIYKWPDGREYEGEFKDDKIYGRGIMKWQDGEVYEGEWKDNKKCGRGIMKWQDGEVYEGEYKDDKRCGHGILRFPDGGSVYEGEWKDDYLCGLGILMFPDGRVYEGEWKDDYICGRGIFKYPNGEVYDGEYKYNMKCGRGIYKWPDGRVYEGKWKDNKRCGRGKLSFPDGREYDGEFKDDKICGHGILRFPDGGAVYDGELKDGKICGRGIFKYPNGEVYEGEYKDDKRCGRGIYKWPDQREYDGEYKDDKRCGHGIFKWPDGRVYEGEWKDNKRCGRGVLKSKDGVVIEEGLYENGKYIGDN